MIEANSMPVWFPVIRLQTQAIARSSIRPKVYAYMEHKPVYKIVFNLSVSGMQGNP